MLTGYRRFRNSLQLPRYRVPLRCPFHLPCTSLATSCRKKRHFQVKIQDSLPTTHLRPTYYQSTTYSLGGLRLSGRAGGATGNRPLARAISMRVISPFCGSIELALIHTDGTGKGLDCVFLLRASAIFKRAWMALGLASVEVGPYHAITTGAQYGLSASHRGCRHHHTLYYGCPVPSFTKGQIVPT